MKTFKNLRIFLVLLTLAFVVSCQTIPKEYTFAEKTQIEVMRGLNTAKDARLLGLETANTFWKRGLLTEEQALKIAVVGDDFQEAINKTSLALEEYYITYGANQKDLDEKIIIYQTIYTAFNDLVMPLIIQVMEEKENG